MADASLSPPAARGPGLPMLAALAERNFRLYWSGLISYVLGWRIEYVTYAWVVWELTYDPLYLGFYGVAEGVPLVLCQLFGGVLADRARRLPLLIGTQCVTAATLTVAFLLTASAPLGVRWKLTLAASEPAPASASCEGPRTIRSRASASCTSGLRATS